MKAIILSAGQGQRLMPLTAECPKGMVKVGGRPILEYQIQMFRSLGIEDISVVGGYKQEALQFAGVKKYVNDEFSSTNMVYTLFCASAEMDSDVVVSYADILYSRDVLSMVVTSAYEIAVAVDLEWETYFAKRAENILDDAESLKMCGGRIVELGGTVDSIGEIEAQYIGLMKFSRSALGALRSIYADALSADSPLGWGSSARKAYMTDLLQECVNRSITVHAVPIRGDWFEVDTPLDLKIAESMLNTVIRNN